MARQVLPVVGAVVGGYFGGPSGAQAGWAIGSVVGNLVDPAIAQGPKMGELPLQTSQEGQPISIIYGTTTCSGFILCFGQPKKTTEIESGEKGAPKSEVEVVYRDYAIAICEGEVSGLLRVWENDKVVYDVRPGSPILEASQIWMKNKKFYSGNETQMPDVYLELNVSGIGNTPAYRGLSYMVFGNEDLTDTQGAIKQYRWEIAKEIDNATWPDYGWEVVETTAWTSLPAVAVSPDGLVVAVGLGSAGTTYSSSDLITWTTGTIPNGANAIAYGNGMFAAVDNGSNNHVWIGGGTTWTDVPTPTPWDKDGIAYGNGIFVITGHNNGLGTKLTAVGTGGGWTEHTIATNISGRLRFANTLFVSLQAGQISFSSEGVVWTQQAVPMPTPKDIVWAEGPGKWVLLGSDGGISGIATSPDLATWTVATVPGGSGQQWFTGAWSEELSIFTAIGNGGDFVTSPDLVTWTSQGTVPGGGGQFTDAVWSTTHDKFIAVEASPGAIVVSDTQPAVVEGKATNLGAIVADQHARARIPVEDFDVSEINPIAVTGMTITGDYTASDVINTLRSCYFFDKAEPGDKLYYPLRGKPVVATLDFDDLVDIPDLSKREQLSEVPKKLHLHSLDPTAGYAPVKATYERSSVDVKAVADQTVSVPVVLDVDERQQMVHKMFKAMTADAQGEIKLSIPDSFVRLIPSDCVGLVLRGQIMRLRLDEDEWADGVKSGTYRRDRQSAYTSELTGIPIPEPAAPPSAVVGDTVFVVMDMSARQDSEDDLHVLVAGTGASDGWPGWALQRSLDGGANWTTVSTYNSADIIGNLVEDLPDADENVTDTTNTVRVQLIRPSQSLESQTPTQFLSEGGAFCLENGDGTWEVLQALDWVEESSGTFAGSTLHRGRLNSGSSAHAVGAKFVWLQSAEHVVMESARIGQSVRWRGVSLGQSPELATVQTATYVGRSQLEWPVASLSLSRSGNNVTATWAPRHRFGTDDAPVASSNFTGYRITIVGTSTVTFDQTASTFTYDVSAIGGAVTVSVQALNRITGAGPAMSGTA